MDKEDNELEPYGLEEERQSEKILKKKDVDEAVERRGMKGGDWENKSCDCGWLWL